MAKLFQRFGRALKRARISASTGLPLGVSLENAMRILPGERVTSSRYGRSFCGYANGLVGFRITGRIQHCGAIAHGACSRRDQTLKPIARSAS
jgi:hypothetical protein